VVSLQPSSPDALSRLGTGLLVGGRKEEGIHYVQSALEVDPGYYPAGTMLILHYLHNNLFDKALEVALGYVDRDTKSSVSYNLLARVYLFMGEDDEAVKAFERARKLSPGDPYASHSLAFIALKRNEVEEARKKYMEVLGYHNDYLPSILGLASLDALQNNERAMVDRLKRSIRLYPNEIEPRLILSRYYIAEGKPSLVFGLIQDLTDIQKNTPSVLEVSALYKLGINEFSSARYSLEKLLEKKDGNYKVHFLMAKACEGEGDLVRSKVELEKSIKLNSDYYPSRIAFANLSLIMGDEVQAELQLEELKVLAPDHPEVMRLIASINNDDDIELLASYKSSFDKDPSALTLLLLSRHQWKMGGYVEAEDLQKKWLENNPDDVTVRLSLASYYRLMKREDESVEQYLKVVEIDSVNSTALNNLAWSLRKTDANKALGYAKRANNASGSSAATLDTLAVVFLENGEIQKAQRNISRALDRSPKDRSMRYHSAMIDVAAGDKRTALTTLISLLEDGNDFPEKDAANKLLKKIQSEG